MRSTQTDPTRPTAGHFYEPGVLTTLEETAATLLLDCFALRDDCDRRAHVCGTIPVVRLPGGVMGFRIHGIWRFLFPISGPGPSDSDRSHKPSTGEGQ
jgi:hypothetical protein